MEAIKIAGTTLRFAALNMHALARGVKQFSVVAIGERKHLATCIVSLLMAIFFSFPLLPIAD
jgi:hypothetical protein